MKIAQVLTALTLGFLVFQAQAFETKACAPFQTTNDVVDCMVSNHPEVRKTEADQRDIEGMRKSGEQIPNPVVGFDTSKGMYLGDVQGENNLSLSQLIEIGGKRSARKKWARAGSASLLASSNVGRDTAKINLILMFVRYRQILAEIAVLEEALQTSARVNRQYASRPRLSPDQQVNSMVFKLALGDYRHRQTTLVSEKNEIEAVFQSIPGFPWKRAEAYLPPRVTSWPKVIGSKEISDSPRMKIIEAEKEKADAEYDLAKANSWPDPTVSVMARDIVTGPYAYRLYGVGISMPLPVFNINGGERGQKAADKYRAEVLSKTAAVSLQLQYKNLLTNYQNAVSAIGQTPDLRDTERKHKATEELFYRGTVAGTLVIEAHRQLLDFTQTSNELETHALERLLMIYSFEGRLHEFKF